MSASTIKINQRDRIETFNASGKIEAVFYGYDCPPLNELMERYYRVVVKSQRGILKFIGTDKK